eukprot:1531850-Rhodomonas_salina.1
MATTTTTTMRHPRLIPHLRGPGRVRERQCGIPDSMPRRRQLGQAFRTRTDDSVRPHWTCGILLQHCRQLDPRARWASARDHSLRRLADPQGFDLRRLPHALVWPHIRAGLPCGDVGHRSQLQDTRLHRALAELAGGDPGRLQPLWARAERNVRPARTDLRDSISGHRAAAA